ncbi:hypothetical protein H4R24_001112 [Coemansia sp. RSA 988]|nr:hypothetical protein H4R24_001112 [Coemansia sp. RSA 988]
MDESRRRMELSRASTAAPRTSSSTPMNYWVTSDDESSIYSDINIGSECGSIAPSSVDLLDIEQNYTPLRSAPKPTKPNSEDYMQFPVYMESPNHIHNSDYIAQRQRYSRDEWEEKAEEALFGSCRTNRHDTSEHIQVADDADSTIEGKYGWDDMREEPGGVGSETETEFGEPAVRPPKASKQASGVSLRAGQSPHNLCSTALNDLLFTTNAQIDTDLHDMLEDYINGRGISNFTDDFELIVDHAYAGFITAAKSILDVTEEATARPSTSSDHSNSTVTDHTPTQPGCLRRHASSRYAGSMESLLSEIVDCYMNQTEDYRKPNTREANGNWKYSHMRSSPRQSLALEDRMQDFGIDIVKYNKEQLRRYAVTGITKYVSGQVLLSTGIENDLADRLDQTAETLRMVMQQISTLETLHQQNKEALKNDRDMAGLRKKAFRFKRTVKQLRVDAMDASNVRRIFEMALLEIQLL